MRIAQACVMAFTPFLLNAGVLSKAHQKPSTENVECDSAFHVMHADVRHTESKGLGYDTGYTTLTWFGTYDGTPNLMPFLDLRGHVFNDGRLAGNIGIGMRNHMASINHLFSLYIYYDIRQEHHDLTVNQFSPGIEILGKRMEYRINAYLPFGNDESHSYHARFERFQGNRMMIKTRKKYAMKGVDAEVGAHLNRDYIWQPNRHDVYLGVGPYYFTDDPSNVLGGKGRLYWRYKEYITLEANYSYDHIFKNIIQGTITLSYPFGKKLQSKGKTCADSNSLLFSRAAFAPYRFEIPVVETHHHIRTARNPATRQPFTVWFVRNTSSSDGTYKSPFPTLAQAQNASGPNDIIYVFPGDGTSRGMNTGITLKDGQFLFGSGTVQTVNTTKGRVNIPAHSPIAPTISNFNSPVSVAGARVVVLANGNEVSGMNIVPFAKIFQAGEAGQGVFGLNTAGADIHNNIIGNLGEGFMFGVALQGSMSNITIANNRFIGPLVTANLGSSNIVFLPTGSVNSDVNIVNNRITGNDFGINSVSTPLGSPFNGNISGNFISDYRQEAIEIQ